MRWIIALLATCSLISPLSAAGKKIPKNRLTFHIQGDRAEGQKMVFPQAVYGQQIFFRRSPEIFTKDLVAFTPFAAKDGSLGATFYLSKVATTRFAAATTQNQKSWLIAMFNGRPLDAVMIDRPVNDGQIVIWQGMDAAGIMRFDLMIPRRGDTKETWKARKKLLRKQAKK